MFYVLYGSLGYGALLAKKLLFGRIVMLSLAFPAAIVAVAFRPALARQHFL